MVRNYKRKTDRSLISEEAVVAAIELVKQGCTVSQAAKTHGLSRSTLVHRLKKVPLVRVVKPRKTVKDSRTREDVTPKDELAVTHDHNLRKATHTSRRKRAKPVKIVQQDDVTFEYKAIDPQAIPSAKYNHRQVFSIEQEDQLVEYLQQCCTMNNGLTSSRVRELAVEFAVRVNCEKIPSSWLKKGSAGKDWLFYFKSRHKDLKLHRPWVPRGK